MRMVPDVAFFHRLKDDISNHFEMRIQLFLQQVLLTYQTGKEYVCDTTYLQVGSGTYKEEQISSHLKTWTNNRSCFAAAHSNTVPCLKYRPTDRKKDPQPIVSNDYCKDTWNATVLLPKKVNDVDSFLDGRNTGGDGQENKLRWCALKIINKTAHQDNSDFTPHEALKEYIIGAINLLDLAEEKFTDMSTLLYSENLFNELPFKDLGDKSLQSLFLQTTESELDNPSAGIVDFEQLIVTNFYKEVAVSYQKQLTDPNAAIILFKKFCFCVSDTSQSLDGNFFRRVQQLMLPPVDKSLPLPQAISINKASLRVKPPVIQTAIKVQSVVQALPLLGVTAEKYKKACLEDKDILQILSAYVEKDADNIKSIENKLKAFIKTEFGKTPQKINDIAQHVLHAYKASQ
jgi:hypothetical protein